MSASASNFVSQTSQSEETPAQQASSQLLLSATATKSEGIPIHKLLPAEENGSAGDNTNSAVGKSGEDVSTRPADSSEIRKRRLEKLASKEAVDQPQQPQMEEAKDDEVIVADTWITNNNTLQPIKCISLITNNTVTI